MAKISELPLLTNPGTTTRLLALDVSAFPYSSKTVTIAELRNKIISLGVIDIGSTLIQNTNGSFDVKVAIPSQTGNDGGFLTTNGTSISWATLNSTFPSQTNNSGNYLTTNGTSVSWGSITKIPEQVNRAGQYLTTNGTTASWVAIGASLLATQASNSGKYLTTNGSTSSWVAIGASLLATQTGNTGKYLTTNGSTSSWVAIGASLLPSHTGNTGSFLITNGSTSSWTKLTLSSLTNVVLSSPTTGQVLRYNGTNWINSTTVNLSTITEWILPAVDVGLSIGSPGKRWESVWGYQVYSNYISLGNNTTSTSGYLQSPDGVQLRWNGVNIAGAVGLLSRQSFSTSTSVISSGTTANVTISNAYKGYILYKIAVTTSSWVRIYTDTASRIADAGRSELTDPTPGSGVIAEVITTGSQTLLISPGTIGFSNETSPSTNIELAITNKSNGATIISVTLTVLQIEA